MIKIAAYSLTLFVLLQACAHAGHRVSDAEESRDPRYAPPIETYTGAATDTVYTCDCSEAYVRINSEYMNTSSIGDRVTYWNSFVVQS